MVMIKHFSHEHDLILKELVQEPESEGGLKKVCYCYGCNKSITAGTAYECEICDLFLHQSCGDAPERLTQPLHADDLKLVATPPAARIPCTCFGCNQDCSGFTYKCIFDNCTYFYLDVVCATSLGIIKVVNHEHPLSYVLRIASFDCNACGLKHEGMSYRCSKCKFCIDPDCASLPASINLPQHHHVLEFGPCMEKKIYSRPNGRCKVCSEAVLYWWNLYVCSTCEYYAHVKCAMKRIREVETGLVSIRHFSHYHDLILKENEVPKSGISESKKVYCYGCRKQITAGESWYVCEKCDLFLHKSCGDAPETLTHPMHPDHKLTLLTRPPRARCLCDACGQEWRNFTYTCHRCDFDLDIVCASLPKTTWRFEVHKHEMSLVPRVSIICCDACGCVHEGLSYQCSKCYYWIQPDCALIPTEFITLHDHPHRLEKRFRSFLQGLSEVECGICSVPVQKKYDYYTCRTCEHYYVHSDCAIKRISALEERSDDIYIGDYGGTILKLPFPDDSIDTTTRLRDRSENTVESSELIRHFSHIHYLRRFDLQINNVNELGSACEQCDACAKPISSTYYGCTECKFFLHEFCANLPRKIQHPVNPSDILTLIEEPGFFKCPFCMKFCSGLKYIGDLCVSCSFLPRMIHHDVHEHPLILSQISDNCYACEERSSSYQCMTCEFGLHVKCALLPYSVTHKHESKPLTLIYAQSDNQGDSEGYCDICEDGINLVRDFYYYSEEREYYAHITCIYKNDQFSNVKPGFQEKSVLHRDHMLSVIILQENDQRICDYCESDLRNEIILSCEECNLNLHINCHNDDSVLTTLSGAFGVVI